MLITEGVWSLLYKRALIVVPAITDQRVQSVLKRPTMNTLPVLLAVLGLALAGPAREKRETGCQEAAHDIPNVCAHNPGGLVFFPHPTDPSKFLQCDVFQNMYIVQCPPCQVFSYSTGRCQSFTSPPVTVTLAHVVTTPPNMENSPCTPDGMARGNLYFPVANDTTRFIECDTSSGRANTMLCPDLHLWDQSVLSCTRDTSLTSGISGATILYPNPCTADALKAGHIYFPYTVANSFIQCDNFGNGYINTCPQKFFWNAYLQTCFLPNILSMVGRK